MKSVIFKQFIIAAVFQVLFAANAFSQKYENGTRLLKGAEVLSATPLQLDYVLEKLADTAKITVNVHEGKTHLVLDDGSGEWREWWYHQGKWKLKTTVESDPTVPGHVKSITTANVANWNAAFAWGDHAAQGYLKNYTLPVATASVLGGVKTGNRVTIATDGTISANQQAWTDITGKPNFATVATTGNYNDLTNRPTITPGLTVQSGAWTPTVVGGGGNFSSSWWYSIGDIVHVSTILTMTTSSTGTIIITNLPHPLKTNTSWNVSVNRTGTTAIPVAASIFNSASGVDNTVLTITNHSYNNQASYYISGSYIKN